MKVRELEHGMGPQDAEVNLMYILTQTSRTGSSIFELFSTSGRSDHLVASRNRSMNFQKKKSSSKKDGK